MAGDSNQSEASQQGNPYIENVLGPQWVGGWYELGTGSFGTTNVFLRQDVNGTVVDRVVVKDSHFTGRDETWNAPELWTVDPTLSKSKIPVEVWAMYKVRDRVGSENVVRIRNWHVQTNKMMHRIYMEYCPWGDIFDLKSSETETPWEPFLWHCFEDLARAGLLLEQGSADLGASDSEWKLIIHRDMKLANGMHKLGQRVKPSAKQVAAFQGDEQPSRYCHWPTIKLGDFGAAVRIMSDTETAAGWTLLMGTDGNRAPEEDGEGGAYVFNGENYLRPLTSKANVWGVGNVIWSLMAGREGDDTVRYNGPNDDDEVDRGTDALEPDFTVPRQKYSQRLCNLVERCVRYWPEDRIGFKSLLGKIERDTDPRRQHDSAQGLRLAPEDDPIWSSVPPMYKRKPDGYRLGLTVRDIAKAKERAYTPDSLDVDFRPPANEEEDLGGRAGAEISDLLRQRQDRAEAVRRNERRRRLLAMRNSQQEAKGQTSPEMAEQRAVESTGTHVGNRKRARASDDEEYTSSEAEVVEESYSSQALATRSSGGATKKQKPTESSMKGVRRLIDE